MTKELLCDHTYGASVDVLVNADTYHAYEHDLKFTKFTYCPWCKVQLHTLDGIVLGIPAEDEDDCIKKGCAD